jgi:hypothetical protein
MENLTDVYVGVLFTVRDNLSRNQLPQGLFFLSSQEREFQSKADPFLVSADLTTQLQPLA